MQESYNRKFLIKNQNNINPPKETPKEDINKIINLINEINVDDRGRARQELNNYSKYKYLQAYKDKDKLLNNIENEK